MQDPSDSLTGDPGDSGDDPLDRGVAPPERWSAGMRFGVTADEQEEGESLDQLLSEEEPDPTANLEDDDVPEGQARGRGENEDEDEDEADEYVDGLLLDDGPDPRAGRLVSGDEGSHPATEADLIAHDAGIDGGAATAEEAAVHVVEDDDTDIRSEETEK